MFTAKIENSSGNVLTLTGQEAVYQVIGITGLNPPQAQINTSPIVGLDGALFNSAKLDTRNIVITVKINGDVETNRLNLYSYFKTKEPCKFYYTNDSVDVYIEGYVENVECDYFVKNETAQISIICPSTYFKSLSEIIVDSSNEFAQFEFPFTINSGEPVVLSTYEESDTIIINNASESSTGAIIEVDVLSDINSFEIKNTVTGEDLTLNYSFLTSDTILINTNKGQKSLSLIRNGVKTNIFSALQTGSTFLQLAQGANRIEYSCNGGAVSNNVVNIAFKFSQLYRGV